MINYKGRTSLLDQPKLNALEDCLRLSRHVTGDLAELGVYRGGTALFMADCVPEKTIHLFDTFVGIPLQGSVDWHKVGAFCDTQLDIVERSFEGTKAIFHVGVFPGTIPKEELKFACVHLDCDQYQTMKEALEYFYPRLSVGGYIIVDDYQYELCQGVEKALTEYCEAASISFTSKAPCQAIIHK